MDGNIPKQSDSLGLCSIYSGSSCCTNPRTLKYFLELFEPFNSGHQNCAPSSKCFAEVQKALCAGCSPKSAKYFRNASINYCPSFAESLWDKCNKEKMLTKAGACDEVINIYGSKEGFFADLGSIAAADGKDCYMGDDLTGTAAVDSSGGGGTNIVPIVVPVCCAIALIAVAVVVLFVVWFRKSTKKKAPPPMMGTTSADPNTGSIGMDQVTREGEPTFQELDPNDEIQEI